MHGLVADNGHPRPPTARIKRMKMGRSKERTEKVMRRWRDSEKEREKDEEKEKEESAKRRRESGESGGAGGPESKGARKNEGEEEKRDG